MGLNVDVDGKRSLTNQCQSTFPRTDENVILINSHLEMCN